MEFSIMIPVYNEENRIRMILDSIVGHCDDIVIIDKSSTDNTRNIIFEFYPSARVISFPYSNKGEDDFLLYNEFAKYDWVFVCVASEVVPDKFWFKFVELIESGKMNTIDIVMVPRKYHCFGSNVKNSPWDVAYFPFFFNKNRIVYTGELHVPFSIKDERKRLYLHLERSEMIIHNTHATYDSFIRSSINYGGIEAGFLTRDNACNKMQECVEKIYEGNRKFKDVDFCIDAVSQYAAWNLYWSMHMLMFSERYKELGGRPKKNFLTLSFSRRFKIYLRIKLRRFFLRYALFRILYNKIKNE
ncbi:glycosyltransferase [Marinomonas profundimaris]|uniref:Glycosyltransferase 2-like domain-containing protein n=1 Tax=Marinomonas profundimaris TaxID=1208321 RepID=W1RW34_9GAMM|nr:glycosyltransferase [Marinomonas profundimaris]ETI61426.1 hypothetical protein D104_05740 [Marinomonas profundimaris]